MAVRHLKRQRPQAAEWRALVAGSYLPPAAFDELFAGVVQLAAAVLRLADAKFQPARVADQLAALKLPPQVRPSKQRIPKPLRPPPPQPRGPTDPPVGNRRPPSISLVPS